MKDRTGFFWLCIGLLMSVSEMCQAQATFNSLSGSFPDSKRMEVVNTTTVKIGAKGMRSLTLSFNKGDTIIYKISREHQRKASFSLLDSSALLYEKKFKKANIISGGFIADGLATYLFKIKNHSFLNNTFVLDVKKAPYRIDLSGKTDSIIQSTTSIIVDSVTTLLDSVIYLASTLNLNQPSEFIIPYAIEKEYDLYIVTPKEITLKTFTVNRSNNGTGRRTKLACESLKRKDELVIYITVPEAGWEMTDSLAALYIGKDVTYCQVRLSGSGTSVQNIVLANEEKVPGKHLRVRLKEIVKTKSVTTKKVANSRDVR